MNWKRSTKTAAPSPVAKGDEVYLLHAQNRDWLVLKNGNPDTLLGTFRNKRDAEAFLKLKQEEAA